MKVLYLSIIPLSLILAPFFSGGMDGTTSPSANEAFRSVQRIVTPDGIQTQRFLKIGGIDQWISIRGRHHDNPILLFLHGGPGFTSLPASYYYQANWEEYFALVQWDQRGAGKTYLANDPTLIRPTMNIDRMVADTEELVGYLRSTYGRRRIVLMGHSWGTVLGVRLAQLHPDWFYAYVGMAQFVNFERSETMGYQAALAAAQADHNRTAIAELEAIAPFPDPQHPERNWEHLEQERRWLTYYNGYTWHAGEGHDDEVSQFSPDYSPRERTARLDGIRFSLQALWGPLSRVNFTGITHFGCPVVFLQGRHDLTTSATVLGQWYKTLHAPDKKLIWFEDSAHMVFEEEPGKVLATLVQDVLPLTYGQQ
jgi:proline iminopeptidase